jgi:hypothetical protein
VRALSPQQLDPLGGVTAQAFAWIFTVAAIGTSAGVSFVHRDEYLDAALLVLAYACLALACAVVLVASSPRRAPFTWRSALVVDLAGLAAVVLEAAAQWGANVSVRSDWAPLALALLVMAMACFRPARELLVTASVSALVVVAVTVSGTIAADAPLPPAVYAGLTGGPLLAAGVGSAAFSATLVRRLLRWREQTSELRRAEAERIRSRVRAELHDERLALVESEVGPFLRDLLERGELTSDDADRARALSDALRRALVEEADGIWLGGVVTELRDPHGLAARMDDTQRAVVEAACASLADRHTAATLDDSGARARFTLHWSRGGRGRLGPELQAMLRIVFPGARVQLATRRVELEFDAG